jgi:hypothetical protein
MLVNMVIKHEDCGCNSHDEGSDPVNIVFLIDASSPYTFLSRDAIDTLMPDQSPQTKVTLHVHSERLLGCRVAPADSAFANINILGSDFFELNHLSLVANFRQNSLVIKKDEHHTSESS